MFNVAVERRVFSVITLKLFVHAILTTRSFFLTHSFLLFPSRLSQREGTFKRCMIHEATLPISCLHYSADILTIMSDER